MFFTSFSIPDKNTISNELFSRLFSHTHTLYFLKNLLLKWLKFYSLLRSFEKIVLTFLEFSLCCSLWEQSLSDKKDFETWSQIYYSRKLFKEFDVLHHLVEFDDLPCEIEIKTNKSKVSVYNKIIWQVKISCCLNMLAQKEHSRK